MLRWGDWIWGYVCSARVRHIVRRARCTACLEESEGQYIEVTSWELSSESSKSLLVHSGLQADEAAAPDSWEERAEQGASGGGAPEEGRSQMEVEGEGVMESIVELVRLTFKVGVGGLVSVGLRAAASGLASLAGLHVGGAAGEMPSAGQMEVEEVAPAVAAEPVGGTPSAGSMEVEEGRGVAPEVAEEPVGVGGLAPTERPVI